MSWLVIIIAAIVLILCVAVVAVVLLLVLSGGHRVIKVNTFKGAVELARSIYPESSNKEVVSTLIYGVQWDAVMNFIDSNYVNVPEEGEEFPIPDGTGYLDGF